MMIDFFKKYWLFIMINVVVLLLAILFFIIVTGSPREGGVLYQFN